MGGGEIAIDGDGSGGVFVGLGIFEFGGELGDFGLGGLDFFFEAVDFFLDFSALAAPGVVVAQIYDLAVVGGVWPTPPRVEGVSGGIAASSVGPSLTAAAVAPASPPPPPVSGPRRGSP